MDINGTNGLTPSGGKQGGTSFAESLRKEGPASAAPQMAAARSFQSADLAAGLSAVSPDFVPVMGDGILGAIGLGEGAAEAMRRFEEETNPNRPR
jgi:hypothetical protein